MTWSASASKPVEGREFVVGSIPICPEMYSIPREATALLKGSFGNGWFINFCLWRKVAVIFGTVTDTEINNLAITDFNFNKRSPSPSSD